MKNTDVERLQGIVITSANAIEELEANARNIIDERDTLQRGFNSLLKLIREVERETCTAGIDLGIPSLAHKCGNAIQIYKHLEREMPPQVDPAGDLNDEELREVTCAAGAHA